MLTRKSELTGNFPSIGDHTGTPPCTSKEHLQVGKLESGWLLWDETVWEWPGNSKAAPFQRGADEINKLRTLDTGWAFKKKSKLCFELVTLNKLILRGGKKYFTQADNDFLGYHFETTWDKFCVISSKPEQLTA